MTRPTQCPLCQITLDKAKRYYGNKDFLTRQCSQCLLQLVYRYDDCWWLLREYDAAPYKVWWKYSSIKFASCLVQERRGHQLMREAVLDYELPFDIDLTGVEIIFTFQ